MGKAVKILAGTAAIAVVGFVIFFFVLAASITERVLNPVISKPPYPVSDRAARLHETLFVADMHADSLLWNRDLNADGTVAQADVPKLMRGNVALQAFTVVTKTPRGLNIESNSDSTDNIFLLALAQRQPLENLTSLTKRALWQARRLHEYAAASGGTLTVIENKRDLAAFVERRKTQKMVGGWLGIEGAHALDNKLENLDALYNAGFRMISPTHFFDNDLAGSAHGIEKYGLTDKGRELVRRMESRRMLVDIAHASPRAIDDVLAMATRPVVVSHTGVKGTCDNNRNLSDEQLRRVAATGGVIGIGFWDTAVCGEDARSVARAIKYAAGIAGVEHVALGSDFDGSVKVPFDTSGEALITEALIAEGLGDADIALLMGGNVLRLLSESLPE
jgi:microsomal dipeptidase-like Zn-dependent dipeptidase